MPSLLRCPRRLQTGLLLVLATTSAFAAAPRPSVEVTVTASAANPVDSIGRNTMVSGEIQRQTTATLDLNEIARTLNNVQFDSSKGSVSEDAILNLRPSLLSISGGRTNENNFVIAGLSTTSVTDTTNTNIHAYDSVVGHPQTTFLNPSLVGSLSIYESNVPARFSGFTGGVVEADLRDPSGTWGGGVAVARTGSNWVHYRTSPGDVSNPMPEKPSFNREVYDVHLDVPLSSKLSALLGWSRQSAVLENTQKLSTYGGSRRAETVSDNFTAKFLYAFTPETKLRYTSIWTPYRQENTEQDTKIQNNDGWLNKLELTRTTDRTKLVAYAGFQWGDNSREQKPDLYNYKNFGAGDKVDWVADTASSGARGGNGDMRSTQRDIPVGGEYSIALTETGRLTVGADYIHTQARKQRPETNNAYRHQTSSSVVVDPAVTSAYGASDPTVIEGEQALNYRLTYLAFDAIVELQSADAWAEWSDQGTILGLPWNYRAGLRYDTNDFLKNHDVAPRLTGQFEPFRWLKLHAGYNRYHTHSMLAYKLQEKYPDTYAYTRTYTLVDGKKVYSDNWSLYLHSKAINYAQAGLKTPYSDEFSCGVVFDLSRLGAFHVSLLKRQTRDEFVRGTAEKLTYINEKTGRAATYTRYTVSNDGWRNYDSIALEWEKRWRNHQFRIGATFSDTETSTAEDSNYFSDSYDDGELDEIVYYGGSLVTRRQVALVRQNFDRPTYVNFAWSSDWLGKRLQVDLLGRWNTAYDRVEDSNTTITINGSRYDRYDDVHVPAGIINDLNLRWVAWQGRPGTLAFELKVANVLDRTPYSEGASTSEPYQEGRSFWAKTSYSF